jgi:branched-subunit amino acid transport protein
MELWLTIILAGLMTYGIRLSFIAAHGRIDMPEWFTRALTYVPIAVLSAIIAPELLTRDSALVLSLGNARLLGGLVAILVAWRTKSIWLTIAIGMIVMLVLQAVLGI